MEQRFTALEWAAMQGGNDLPAPAEEKFSFLNELVEARMYRNASTLNDKHAKELGKIVYLMFMMLEILRHEDKSFAKKYSLETMWYDGFTSMKSTSSDLHNLLAVLSNQDKYAGKIHVDHTVAVPNLQIRKYLRDIENDRKDKGWDRAFFKTLSEYLKVSDSDLREMRMYVADWDQTSVTERRKLRLQIKNILQPINQQNDLLTHFRTIL